MAESADVSTHLSLRYLLDSVPIMKYTNHFVCVCEPLKERCGKEDIFPTVHTLFNKKQCHVGKTVQVHPLMELLVGRIFSQQDFHLFIPEPHRKLVRKEQTSGAMHSISPMSCSDSSDGLTIVISLVDV